MKKILSLIIAGIIIITSTISVNLTAFAKDERLSINICSNITCDYFDDSKSVVFDGKGMYCCVDFKFTAQHQLLSKNKIKSYDDIEHLVFREGISLVDGFLIAVSQDYPQWTSFLNNVKSITLPKSLKAFHMSYDVDLSKYLPKLEAINYAGGKEDWDKIRGHEQLDFCKLNTNAEVEKSTGNYTNSYLRPEKEAIGTGVVPGDNSFARYHIVLDYIKCICTINCIDKKGILKPTVSTDASYSPNFLRSLNFYDYDETSYGTSTVENIDSYLESIIVSDGFTGLYDYTFRNLSYMKSITLPSTIKSIGKNCFLGCDSLKTIYFQGNYDEWKNIKIAAGNDTFKKAKVVLGGKVNIKDLTCKLSASSYAYDGKSHTPAVTVTNKFGRELTKGTDYSVAYDSGRKAIGKYSVTIQFTGQYSGKKTLYFTIVPKGTTITSVTPAKKALTVKWNKQTSQTDGYELQISTSSSFKAASTITINKNTNYAKKITDLKSNNRYYFRIRTYKYVNNVKYYSAWSKAKNAITK